MSPTYVSSKNFHRHPVSLFLYYIQEEQTTDKSSLVLLQLVSSQRRGVFRKSSRRHFASSETFDATSLRLQGRKRYDVLLDVGMRASSLVVRFRGLEVYVST